jgi:hypothetical protein
MIKLILIIDFFKVIKLLVKVFSNIKPKKPSGKKMHFQLWILQMHFNI